MVDQIQYEGFPDGSGANSPPSNAGDMGSIPGLERSPREGNGNQFQYSCLKNPMDRRAWQVIVHEVAKSLTQLSNWMHVHTHTQTM